MVYPQDSGARVSAWQGGEVAWSYIDSEGLFKIEELPVGTYTIKVEAEGYYTYEGQEVFTIYGGGTTTAGRIVLYKIPGIITSTYPSDGATDIPLDVQIRINFAKEMDTASVENAFGIDPEVEGVFIWNETKDDPYVLGKYLRFIPSYNLKGETIYTVTLNTTASDLSGVGLSETFSFTFTTRGVDVVSHYPLDGDVDVSTQASINISFRSVMDQQSVIDALSIEPEIEGTINWYKPNKTFSFYPLRYWATNTLYTVKIDTTAKDTSGVNLSDSLVFSFTIEGIKIRYSYPYDKSMNVRTDTYIHIEFNTLMEQSSVIEAYSLSPSTDGEFHWANLSEFWFYPYNDLAADSNYSVKIDTAAYDLHGSKLDKEFLFDFRTEPIRIVTNRPEKGETYVDPNSYIYIGFNTDMDQVSVVDAFRMVDFDSVEIEGGFNWNGLRGMTFYPGTTLEYDKEYLVTINTQAKDLHGVSLPRVFSLWFRTKPSD